MLRTFHEPHEHGGTGLLDATESLRAAFSSRPVSHHRPVHVVARGTSNDRSSVAPLPHITDERGPFRRTRICGQGSVNKHSIEVTCVLHEKPHCLAVGCCSIDHDPQVFEAPLEASEHLFIILDSQYMLLSSYHATPPRLGYSLETCVESAIKVAFL